MSSKLDVRCPVCGTCAGIASDVFSGQNVSLPSGWSLITFKLGVYPQHCSLDPIPAILKKLDESIPYKDLDDLLSQFAQKHKGQIQQYEFVRRIADHVSTGATFFIVDLIEDDLVICYDEVTRSIQTYRRDSLFSLDVVGNAAVDYIISKIRQLSTRFFSLDNLDNLFDGIPTYLQ